MRERERELAREREREALTSLLRGCWNGGDRLKGKRRLGSPLECEPGEYGGVLKFPGKEVEGEVGF